LRHCGTQGYELGNKTCTKYLIKTEVKITESQRCRDNRKPDTGINLKGVTRRCAGIVSDMSMDRIWTRIGYGHGLDMNTDWIWTWIGYGHGSDEWIRSDGWTESDMDMD
jgi:hypothetical protein